jgi:hypothetical protein
VNQYDMLQDVAELMVIGLVHEGASASDVFDLYISETDTETLAQKPPKFIRPEHHEIWAHVVRKNKHTNYGGAVNHFKRHLQKHGEVAASMMTREGYQRWYANLSEDAKGMHDLLKKHGFEHGYYHGGPPMEPKRYDDPIALGKTRGSRDPRVGFYQHDDAQGRVHRVSMDHKTGQWNLRRDEPKKHNQILAKGHEVGQLAGALRKHLGKVESKVKEGSEEHTIHNLMRIHGYTLDADDPNHSTEHGRYTFHKPGHSTIHWISANAGGGMTPHQPDRWQVRAFKSKGRDARGTGLANLAGHLNYKMVKGESKKIDELGTTPTPTVTTPSNSQKQRSAMKATMRGMESLMTRAADLLADDVERRPGESTDDILRRNKAVGRIKNSVRGIPRSGGSKAKLTSPGPDGSPVNPHSASHHDGNCNY